MREFGEFIRSTRERKNIRAYDLAYALGQNPSWMSRLESGGMTHPPSPTVMDALSKSLEVPMPELFAAMGYPMDESETPVSDPLGASIARAVQGWTPTQKKLLWQYIEAVDTAFHEQSTDDEK